MKRIALIVGSLAALSAAAAVILVRGSTPGVAVAGLVLAVAISAWLGWRESLAVAVAVVVAPWLVASGIAEISPTARIEMIDLAGYNAIGFAALLGLVASAARGARKLHCRARGTPPLSGRKR